MSQDPCVVESGCAWPSWRTRSAGAAAGAQPASLARERLRERRSFRGSRRRHARGAEGATIGRLRVMRRGEDRCQQTN